MKLGRRKWAPIGAYCWGADIKWFGGALADIFIRVEEEKSRIIIFTPDFI
jgi:hypothetical protein